MYLNLPRVYGNDMCYIGPKSLCMTHLLPSPTLICQPNDSCVLVCFCCQHNVCSFRFSSLNAFATSWNINILIISFFILQVHKCNDKFGFIEHLWALRSNNEVQWRCNFYCLSTLVSNCIVFLYNVLRFHNYVIYIYLYIINYID